MIVLLFAVALAQAGPPLAASDVLANRYDHCVRLSESDAPAARAYAANWHGTGGGFLARQCSGLAFAQERNWAGAADAFDAAAREAEVAHDARAATYWAQTGNAWLAAGDAIKARAALDAALASGSLVGLALGEVQLDHARALVAADEPEAARTDLDHALVNAGNDPLAWLLSATLARRMGNVPRAKTDIAQALDRSSDDASVQLEAGNIAALARDEAGARGAWGKAVAIAPDTPAGRSAAAALKQFDVAVKQ